MDDIWTATDCAEYLRVSRKHFLDFIRYRNGFPAQLEWSLSGRPRWDAKAVKDWALCRQSYANAA